MAHHWTAEEAEAAVAAWRASGRPRSAFCRQRGWSATRLERWVRAPRRRRAQTAFVEVREATSPTAHPMRIEIGRAAIVVERGFDRDLLRAVVEALA